MSMYHPAAEAIKCDFCNDWADYQCDICGANFCAACEPHREDDAPVDVCEDCIENPLRQMRMGGGK